MRRLLLISLSLAVGATVFCVFRNAAVRGREEVLERRKALFLEMQNVNRAREHYARLANRIRQLKESALAQPQSGDEDMLLRNLIPTNGQSHLSPEVLEKLLAALGFEWNSQGDYVVLSKDSLPRLQVTPIQGNRLTDSVCSLLAITPEERAQVDSLLADTTAQYNAWAVSHVQRAEPQGDTLAEYTIPADPAFSQSLSNAFASGAVAALGAERAALLMDYASSWLLDSGLRGTGPTVLTIKRPPAGQEQLTFELKTPDGGIMGTSITQWQSIPRAFLPIFPRGWPDLAAREGFQPSNPVGSR